MTSTVRPQPGATDEEPGTSPAATEVGDFQPGGWWARRKASIGDEPRVAALLAAVAAVQAFGGAGLWLVVLFSFDTIDIGWVGSLIASVQLAGLLGGAGLPIVVARHRDTPRAD